LTNQQYPALHLETAIIQGQINQLPHPIYLPPIKLNTSQIVGGNQDVTLTIPGYEGFELIVKANSVTFPDGTRVGPLVVSPVNNDRLPMVPPGGSPSFGTLGWTIQPTGTRFDPPATVKIPNPGKMAAGETAQIVQWDHDLATFVPMGRGTVSEDRIQIVTDVGSGISKAGWGGCVGPDCPLKLTDQFTVTRDYVSAKYHALESHSFLPSKQSEISPASEIHEWYRKVYRSALPQDSFLLGFETERELLDELNSQFLYAQLRNNSI